jgi:hypothetical protein
MHPTKHTTVNIFNARNEAISGIFTHYVKGITNNVLNSMVNMVSQTLSKYGVCENTDPESNDNFEIKYELVSFGEGIDRQDYPVLSVLRHAYDDSNEVEHHVTASKSIFPIDDEKRAIYLFLSHLLGIKQVEDRHIGLFYTYSGKEIAEHYKENPLDKVCVSVSRTQNWREMMGFIQPEDNGVECANIYLDDGRTSILIVYPSRQHMNIAARRVGRDWSRHVKVMDRWNYIDPFKQYSDDKLCNVNNVVDVMRSQYNINQPDVSKIEAVLKEAYVDNNMPADPLTAVITVKYAKMIMKAHGIE